YEIDGCSHALLEPDGYGAPSPRTSFVSRCRCENSTRVAALTRLTVPSGPSSGKPGGTARARRSPEPKRSGSRRVLAKAPGGSRRLRSRPDDYGMVVVVESSSGQLGFDGRSTAARSTASASSAVMWPSPLKSQTVRLHSWRPTADCSTPSASLAVSTQSSSKKLPQTRHSSVVVVTPQPGIATFEHASPASLHVSVVQASESSHERAVPVHEPPEHASLVVQNSPSSHGSVLARFSQALLVSLHASVVHGFASPQSRAGPATHAPLLQTSPLVQNRPSSHGAVLFTLLHESVSSAQVSVVQALASSQVVAGPPTQTPPAHASPFVQNNPSSHGTVLLRLSQTSVASLHVSVVHRLVSAQSRAVPLQAPFAHVSFTVQNSESSHAIVLFTLSQTSVVSLHESFVQTLLSPQSLAGPPTQAPAAQVSAVVQNRPSSHGSVLFTLLQVS